MTQQGQGSRELGSTKTSANLQRSLYLGAYSFPEARGAPMIGEKAAEALAASERRGVIKRVKQDQVAKHEAL